MTNDELHDAGRAFIQREGRLLERRLYATVFEDAAPSGVVHALRGYQNPDGGFGHGLEPDKRCPVSLPIDVLVAFEALVAAGTTDEALVRRGCDYLAAVADDSAAVPLAFPVIERYPRAEHWSDWTYIPGLLPTAGLAGALWRLGVDHPWRAAATAFCWDALDGGLPDDAHALAGVLMFLEQVSDRPRARALAEAVVAHLAGASSYRGHPDDPSYGVTPLHLAPAPDSPWRSLFDDELIDGHLRRLQGDQQPDGGWPLTWQPPGAAATQEWRGIETLRALRVLRAYGR